MSTLRQVSDCIATVSAAQTRIPDAIRNTLTPLHIAFNHISVIHEAATRLATMGALNGIAAAEVAETVARCIEIRELLAECGTLLAEVAGDDNYTRVFSPAARDGAVVKRMAQWEQQWLRSAVVTALAGAEDGNEPGR